MPAYCFLENRAFKEYIYIRVLLNKSMHIDRKNIDGLD